MFAITAYNYGYTQQVLESTSVNIVHDRNGFAYGPGVGPLLGPSLPGGQALATSAFQSVPLKQNGFDYLPRFHSHHCAFPCQTLPRSTEIDPQFMDGRFPKTSGLYEGQLQASCELSRHELAISAQSMGSVRSRPSWSPSPVGHLDEEIDSLLVKGRQSYAAAQEQETLARKEIETHYPGLWSRELYWKGVMEEEDMREFKESMRRQYRQLQKECDELSNTEGASPDLAENTNVDDLSADTTLNSMDQSPLSNNRFAISCRPPSHHSPVNEEEHLVGHRDAFSSRWPPSAPPSETLPSPDSFVSHRTSISHSPSRQSSTGHNNNVIRESISTFSVTSYQPWPPTAPSPDDLPALENFLITRNKRSRPSSSCWPPLPSHLPTSETFFFDEVQIPSASGYIGMHTSASIRTRHPGEFGSNWDTQTQTVHYPNPRLATTVASLQAIIEGQWGNWSSPK
ncbi:hypothetical protein K435DRAFT_969020 [Dendrothele bispora CBS 962.96]|uniref:Uncharacterized protein n=1 Tax=Dendrothele bispora (strain CBS 962.96) TaxID=1314807 RepID=A0A4S8LKX7_DENBC|nr:hypothetical protein K435DRAFT_969020 [Dendrothele bispora CBS 962.96]